MDISETSSKKGSNCRLIFLVPQEGQKNALDLNGSFNFGRKMIVESRRISSGLKGSIQSDAAVK